MPGTQLDLDRVKYEWPPLEDGCLYLNTGSCGRKPTTVLEALAQGWKRLNANPTRVTFLDDDIWDDARNALAELLSVSPQNLLLTQNTTQALQMVMQSFLLQPGDEFITTTHEHGSLRTIARYWEQTRGIVVRRHDVQVQDGSEALQKGILNLVGEKTRLVAVSEISSYSGWRPNLLPLVETLSTAGIPFLADGAHVPGQGPSCAARYPLWVGSGHKWLGAPNGTGALYVQDHLIDRLLPCWLGDHYYNEYAHRLKRFEFPGTCDVVRWLGLTAACRLALQLGQDAVAAYQRELTDYTRQALRKLPGTCIRTPDIAGETSGMIVATWEDRQLAVPHLRTWLWDKHKIWVQPDFCFGNEGHGVRISCHISLTRLDIDRFIDAMAQVLR
jgi:selenocysteine lyase/cysteine desulfurase